jgi:hypothetical protein
MGSASPSLIGLSWASADGFRRSLSRSLPFIVASDPHQNPAYPGQRVHRSKSEWEAHLTASAKIAPTVAINLDDTAVLNVVGGTEVFNTLEPSIGWTLQKNLDLFASWELPLDSASTDWVAKAGLMWFF